MKLKCLNRIKDGSGVVIGYKLRSQDGEEMVLKSNRLKELIKCDRAVVINLKLNSDDRLIKSDADTILND